MPALRRAGGPGGRGSFRFTWNGGRFAQHVQTQTEGAMEEGASRILNRLRTELHKITGEMAEKAFAEVEIRGGRIIIRAGSDADHTAYHELGTATFEGHPQIRQIMDEEIPNIVRSIRARVQT